MGNLAKIVFSAKQEKEVEVLGHKVVFRSLTTRDSLEMDFDYAELAKEENKNNPKAMLKNMIELLAASIVSIDGVAPENRQETKEWLLDQEQTSVIEIFTKSTIIPTSTEEIKN